MDHKVFHSVLCVTCLNMGNDINPPPAQSGHTPCTGQHLQFTKYWWDQFFFPFHNRQSCAFSDHPAKLPVLMRPLFGSAALSVSILHPQGCHAPNWPSSALAQAARIPEVGYGNARPSHMQLHVTLGHYLGHACHTHKISSPELIKQRTEMNFSLVIFLLPITTCTI